ncbi:cysteine hydrolase family protein [Streptomyces sp. NBC_00038]|uniref:cysteine hydrolase family protein n=1 Tax=Streptomyces sp. NBC_00038 TaxID=2903615 RepID=UPI00225B3891|nr:cysteine hydrolase [Streptomyces sp. NBC_00038]MCX5555582.1 cysteine hydrolase [Streptomyces sp. NBC_00038]
MTTIAPHLDPTRTALLLMDFQPAVLAVVPDADQVLSRAHAALSWARSHDVQVAFVRVAFTAEDFAAVPARNKSFAPLAQSGFLADGSPEAALHESFDVHEQDITVRKIRISAFASATDLRAALRDQGIDTLVLAGLSTGGVVLTTLRQAADDDFQLYVLKDATADPDPEVHRVLTEKVFPHQAYVIDTDELGTLSKPA